jgi:hypothetical protein
MGKNKQSKGFGRMAAMGFMGLAALIGAGTAPGARALQAAPASSEQNITQRTSNEKQTPITNPTVINAVRQTPLGNAVHKWKKRKVLGTIPQKHAQRKGNKLHLSKKVKRKHRRA